MHIDVDNDNVVRAQYDDQDGEWQELTIEKDSEGVISSGDSIYLRAHTGNPIDIEWEDAQARYNDKGDWQRFVIEKKDGGEIYIGDTIFLRAHTGKYVDVVDGLVRARHEDMGEWQALTVEERGIMHHL